jgi:glycosyltransferase involved in cell wall biosynthesis
VSVCISNFNYDRFIGRAVESALAEVEGNGEVVVVDDGSTDGSIDVLASYGERVRLVAKQNAGQASALNTGVAAARGDIVLLLDADDELVPGIVSRVVDAFAANPSASRVQYRLEIVDAAGRPTGDHKPPLNWKLPSGDLSGHCLRFRTHVWPPTSGTAYRRQALIEMTPIPQESFRIEADMYLASLSVFCGPVVSLDDRPGARYRLHGANQYAGETPDAAFFRAKIERTAVAHAGAVDLLRRLGRGSTDQRLDEPWDAALLGYRLASLVLDQAGHPFPDDRRVRVALRGVMSALANPQHPWLHRVKRALWFVGTAASPRPLARRLVVAFYGRPA